MRLSLGLALPLVLLAAFTLPVFAAKPITVAQLDQKLAAARASHRSDADLSKQVGDLELCERLTDASLARLNATLPDAPKTRLALRLLADISTFLDPPAGEIPSTPAPDTATQAILLKAARGFVVETLPHLPNLFATRTTYSFDDSPQIWNVNEWPVRAGFRLVRNNSSEITFRDGQEIVGPPPASASDHPAPITPSTPTPASAEPHRSAPAPAQANGEFGPLLVTVITDTDQGKIGWSHWETSSAGNLAVFNYSVPQSAAHYQVDYCCIHDASSPAGRGRGGRRGGGAATATANMPTEEFGHRFHETPAYHGSITIDPASGSIRRIVIETDLKVDDPLRRADTAIQYGPVTLGNKRTICPISSLAYFQRRVDNDEHLDNPNVLNTTPVRVLNEVTFTNYQRLASTVRILPDAADGPPVVGTPPVNAPR